jgi:STAS-like domain of unknown function (DUF4325)
MSEIKRRINVAEEFSETPGPRSPDEGQFSGLEFLEKFLSPRFREAREERGKLYIDLDGTEGYATSFLEAAFGGLARQFEPEDILKNLIMKSDDEDYLVEEIRKYISEARKK